MIAKCLGICMNHANAHLMELTDDPFKTITINSEFTHGVKEESLGKSEVLMHNKEQHEQAAYYKHLGKIIFNYESVLLFGPTQAKTELFNVLRADHHFDKIKIEVKQTDKMTTNQAHAFVQDYFSKS
jgi:hypothetical protein